MKSVSFIVSFFLIFFYSHALAQVSIDANGQSINETSYGEVEGHPYLLDEWIVGTVHLDNNRNINTILKFDIYSSRVLFQDKNGETLELKNKFTGFTLNNENNEISNITPLVFVNGYPPIGDQTEISLYQLIADGKVKLLKYYKKKLNEHRDYYSSVITSNYQSFKLYYIFQNNKLTAIQPNKKTIHKLFDDHSAQLDAYFKANNIDFRSDIDLQKLFAWYNSLN